jgi:hypothetical protein
MNRQDRLCITALSALLLSCGTFLAAHADSPSSPQTPGTVDGSNINSFFGSGATVDPMAMEQASKEADREVNLGPDHKVKVLTEKQAEKEAHGGGLLGGVGRAIEHTGNFIGMPLGDSSIDHGVDASLSADMQNEKNRATNIRLKNQLLAEEKHEKTQEKAAKEEAKATKESAKENKLEKTISGQSSKSPSSEAKKSTPKMETVPGASPGI